MTKTEHEIAKENVKRKRLAFEGCGDKTSTGGTCGNLSKSEELLIYNEGTKKERFESDKIKRYCEECWKNIFQLRGEIMLHKQTCQRFLRFLESLKEKKIMDIRKGRFSSYQREILNKIIDHINEDLLNKVNPKITDLNNAINEYKKAGI